MEAAIETAIIQGRLSIKRIRELKEASDDIDNMVSPLNNMLACEKAVPYQPQSWGVQEELADLYTTYIKSNETPEKLSSLQYLLGINDSTSASLREMGERLPNNTAEVEEFVF
ncbi:hypothetical protein JHK84_031766 [Glycine max]|nr:hypothetical protein JHK87_031450 [Glycine soja]KAG5146223.1 hypothetical protein JHK84_031766 [Glycine max]